MGNSIDTQVDEMLEKCIFSTPRKSFFLFAGAGSGKTFSLVLLLRKIRDRICKRFVITGQKFSRHYIY